MKILIIDDDLYSLKFVALLVRKWGYEVDTYDNASNALKQIQKSDTPIILLVDWMMPAMDGIQFTKILREDFSDKYLYVIMLTSRNSRNDIIVGFNAGTDDYLVKPFDNEELRVRIKVGERILTLQMKLTAKIHELEESLRQVKELKGLLPICSRCKKIKDDEGYWQQVEQYLSAHTDLEFTHGICSDCLKIYYQEIEDIKQSKEK